MNEYGVVQLGEYLVSVPGAILYLISTFLGGLLAWGIASNSKVLHLKTKVLHFRLTKFLVFGLLFVSAITLLWIQLGVWFYVKA
jgi:hypothetical protein